MEVQPSACCCDVQQQFPIIRLMRVHLDELSRARQQIHEKESEPDLMWCSVSCRSMRMNQSVRVHLDELYCRYRQRIHEMNQLLSKHLIIILVST